jgi:hypothetical protein
MQKLDLAQKFLNENTPYTWELETLGGNNTAWKTQAEYGEIFIGDGAGNAPTNWGQPFKIFLEVDGIEMFLGTTTIGAIHNLEFENCLTCEAIVLYNSALGEWFHSDDYDLNECFQARRNGKAPHNTTKENQ